jgi:chromosome segregation ATPase
MIKIAALCLGLVVIGFGLADAQDIAGIEDCTKTSGLDKRTGCLQSNVNFLQQLVTKNALEARQRLNAATTEIAGLKAEVASLKAELTSLKAEVTSLKGVVTGLQSSVEQLLAAQKAASDKKPEKK